MRVNYQEAIAETPEELKLLGNQQKTIICFQKIQSLYLLKTGKVKKITNLSDTLGVHRVTIQKWLRKYQDEGVTGLLAVKSKTGRPPKLNKSAIAELEERLKLAEQGFDSYEKIQIWLEEESQLKIKYKTLYHWVRYKLKAKLKVPRRCAVNKNDEEGVEFKKNYLDC